MTSDTVPVSGLSCNAIPLSSLIRDPGIRAAFLRAERESGAAFAVPALRLPVLSGGAAARPEELRERIEAAVEMLIRFLDRLDAPAEDLEPQGDDDTAADDGPCDAHPWEDAMPTRNPAISDHDMMSSV